MSDASSKVITSRALGAVLRRVAAALDATDSPAHDDVAGRDAEHARASLAAAQERDSQRWVMVGVARLNAVFQEQTDTADLGRRVVSAVCDHVGAQVGALYALRGEEDDEYALLAGHAYTPASGVPTSFRLGEGVVGQAAIGREQVVLEGVPGGYLRVGSGLGDAAPRSICVTPLVFEGAVRGVLELAALAPIEARALELLRQVGPSIAVAIEASYARDRVAAALTRAQQLAAELEVSSAELRAKQDALRSANAELEEQTAALRATDEQLRRQQAELEHANAELTRKNDELLRQRNETEHARRVLAAQADEVALASKYKSEFLANMSHELRTPLNSLLLLARSLRDNPTGNLTDEQVESARIIYEGGSDLLTLINEILDLSKIEAGRMDLHPERIALAELAALIAAQFDAMARAQGLAFSVVVDEVAPATIVTDARRLAQVLKNLVGNALKFTERGRVSVTFARATGPARVRDEGPDGVAILVADTGIGIHPDKHRVVFEAFQQVDGGDRRRFGGTGLGLSISRELVALLGGEIRLVSEPGVGSTFSVHLPVELSTAASAAPLVPSPPATPPRRSVAAPAVPAVAPPFAAGDVEDDRARIEPGDRVLLLIEDDRRFSAIVAAQVRERGFKCLVATSGEEGLALAREHRPHGIVLDLLLPRLDGWAVLELLKQDVALRHIPVHILSVEVPGTQALQIGAIGQLAKPVTREQIEEIVSRLEAASAHATKRVLVVEDEAIMRDETVRAVGNGNVTVDAVGTGREALEALRREQYSLVVTDLGLPDMQGLDLLERATREGIALPPVIVHTVRQLTMDEEIALRGYAESIIVKDVRSTERLIDEVALFLHRVVRDLSEDKRDAILRLRVSDEPLRGKTVLVVDDDVRTVFAMARQLAARGVTPLKADNGRRALALLAEHPEIDLVLLDMMMPEVDGYETVRAIRADARWARLPVIALTAKAMREDRQKCIDAGATDYLAKPVDPERLASLMRVLLCR